MKCRLVAVDPKRDLALLRLKHAKPTMKPLALASRSALPAH